MSVPGLSTRTDRQIRGSDAYSATQTPSSRAARVVVCGSLAHPDRIAAAVHTERAAGRHVIAYPTNEGLPAQVAAALWRRHIDTADEVVAVRKPDGSVGASTRGELDYACLTGKRIRYSRAIAVADVSGLLCDRCDWPTNVCPCRASAQAHRSGRAA